MTQDRPTWDDTFIDLCFTIAKRSKDQSTIVGCVISGPSKEIRAVGYNGIPRNCNDNIAKRHVRPIKYLWKEHAERNAIYNAARVGVGLVGCSLYVTCPPCADCARAIIQVGIKEVICASIDAPIRFKKSCDAAIEMLTEANIVVRLPNNKLQIKKWKYKNEDGWGTFRSRPAKNDNDKSDNEPDNIINKIIENGEPMPFSFFNDEELNNVKLLIQQDVISVTPDWCVWPSGVDLPQSYRR